MNQVDWGLLVDELGPKLYRYFKYKGAADRSSDLTQEVFLRLLEIFERYDKDKGSAQAFAFGVAHKVWLEASRKNQVHEDIFEIEIQDETNVHESVAKADEAQKLRGLVKNLPPVQQDVLYLYFDQQLTTKQIGESLELPEGTIKSHLHRAKEALRVKIEKEWI